MEWVQEGKIRELLFIILVHSLHGYYSMDRQTITHVTSVADKEAIFM